MMTTRMKHLLLIVDAFPPDFAPRMGYLCRCLETMPEASKEWQVTVIAPDEGGRLYDIPYERTEIHRIPLHPTSGPFRSLRWSLGFLGTLLFDLKGRRFRRCVEQICAGRDFDLLLCSTYYTFPLNTALSFSRSHQIPFIADLRDIAEEYTENDFFQHPPASPHGARTPHCTPLSLCEHTTPKQSPAASRHRHVRLALAHANRRTLPFLSRESICHLQWV